MPAIASWPWRLTISISSWVILAASILRYRVEKDRQADRQTNKHKRRWIPYPRNRRQRRYGNVCVNALKKTWQYTEAQLSQRDGAALNSTKLIMGYIIVVNCASWDSVCARQWQLRAVNEVQRSVPLTMRNDYRLVYPTIA